MSTYHTQTFAQRFNQLGDEAEGVFETWATEQKIQFEPYGFIRPKIDRFWQVHPFVRKTPDYLCRGTYPFFCEVKGTGRAYHVKIKVEDVSVLERWNVFHPVWVFIYDNARSQVSFISLQELSEISERSNVAEFSDGTPYFQIRKSNLKWTPIVQETQAHGY